MKISLMNDRRWSGLALSLVLAGMANLTAVTNASRIEEAWPVLLSAEPSRVDPAVEILQQRTRASLERLMQSALPLQPL